MKYSDMKNIQISCFVKNTQSYHSLIYVDLDLQADCSGPLSE